MERAWISWIRGIEDARDCHASQLFSFGGELRSEILRDMTQVAVVCNALDLSRIRQCALPGFVQPVGDLFRLRCRACTDHSITDARRQRGFGMRRCSRSFLPCGELWSKLERLVTRLIDQRPKPFAPLEPRRREARAYG